MNMEEDAKKGHDNETGSVQLSLRKEEIDEIARSVLDILNERENGKNARESKVMKLIDALSDVLSKYWFLVSVVVVLIACLRYGTSPLYPIKQIAIADKELDRKNKKFEFEKQMAARFITLGKNFLDVGKYQDAEKAYSEAVKLDGVNIEATFGLHKSKLLTRSEAKQFDAEVISRRIQLVLDYDKDDSHALSAKANFYFGMGDREKARLLWESALAENDRLAEAHFGLATLYLEQGQFPEAIAALEKAAKIGPHKWEYLNNLANALAQSRDYKEAAAIYQKLWALDPDALLPLMEGANALLMLGQLTNALWVQNQLIRRLQNPELKKLEKNKSPWFFKVGKGEVALNSHEMKRVYAYRFRAFVYFMKKKKSQAEKDFKVKNSLSVEEASDVNALLAHELRILQEQQPDASERITAFRQAYLNKPRGMPR